jgi:hypothetical protein
VVATPLHPAPQFDYLGRNGTGEIRMVGFAA